METTMIDPNLQRIIDSNKKFKSPLKREKKVHRDVMVKFLRCKHIQTFKADDPKAPAWILGAERVDANGRAKATEVYGECPECQVYTEASATTISNRNPSRDKG